MTLESIARRLEVLVTGAHKFSRYGVYTKNFIFKFEGNELVISTIDHANPGFVTAYRSFGIRGYSYRSLIRS
jgi:hypothetical protein